MVWQSYILPCAAALCVHALLALLITGGFGAPTAQVRTVLPVKIVQASLVELKRVEPVRKPAPKKAEPVVREKPPAEVKKTMQPAPDKKVPTKPVVEPVSQKVQAQAAKKALLDQLLADEEEQLAADRERDAFERYGAAMKNAITNRWSRPPSARNNMEVVLSIRLVPTGDVVSVSIKKSSGNSAFDRSASRAVETVERFDMLQGMPSQLFEKHFRNIDITFRPEDLRL